MGEACEKHLKQVFSDCTSSGFGIVIWQMFCVTCRKHSFISIFLEIQDSCCGQKEILDERQKSLSKYGI